MSANETRKRINNHTADLEAENEMLRQQISNWTEWAAAEIKKVETERDNALRRLERLTKKC